MIILVWLCFKQQYLLVTSSPCQLSSPLATSLRPPTLQCVSRDIKKIFPNNKSGVQCLRKGPHLVCILSLCSKTHTLSSFLSKLAAFPLKASQKLPVSSPYGICSISSFTSILDEYYLKRKLS